MAEFSLEHVQLTLAHGPCTFSPQNSPPKRGESLFFRRLTLSCYSGCSSDVSSTKNPFCVHSIQNDIPIPTFSNHSQLHYPLPSFSIALIAIRGIPLYTGHAPLLDYSLQEERPCLSCLCNNQGVPDKYSSVFVE